MNLLKVKLHTYNKPDKTNEFDYAKDDDTVYSGTSFQWAVAQMKITDIGISFSGEADFIQKIAELTLQDLYWYSRLPILADYDLDLENLDPHRVWDDKPVSPR